MGVRWRQIEEDESVEEAARRELREETGLEGTVIRRGDSYISAVDDRYHLIPLLIEAASRDVTMGREHDTYAWIALDELDTYDTLGQEQSLVNLDLR